MRDPNVGPLPTRLYVECTAACNISCFQACCAPETGITRTRQAGMLDFDLFTRVLDEAGPSLVPHRLLQLRRGVPAQARRRDVRVHQDEVPAHLPLHEHQRAGPQRGEGAAARPLGHRRSHLLDRRRLAGHLRALPPARQVRPGDRQPARHGRREGQAGRDVPQLNWRYILFNWNDCGRGDGQGARGWRPSSASIGSRWEITDHPEDSFSRRFAPGTADFDRIQFEVWDVSGLGNAIPGRHAAGRDRRAGAAARRCRCRAGPASRSRVHTQRAQPLHAPVPRAASYGRRLVRLGAQLVGPDGTLINRDYARAWLPGDTPPGAPPTSPIEVPPPAEAGALRAQVRPGERRHRLVREVRLADHDAQRRVR